MIKLSVIVPVYNVEKYVLECINSLLNQSLDSMEIIVVNDGSTDSSMEKILNLKNPKIKIINQKNSGLSSARNRGIEEAKGEYISFVDSDDFIENKNSFENMYNIGIEDNSDIVVGSCVKLYDDGRREELNFDFNIFNKSPMNPEEFLLKSLKTKRVYAPVWLSIYKKDLINKNNLRFMPNIVHEDEEFTPRALLCANKVSIYKDIFYVYRQREGSIINSKKNIKYGKDILKIVSKLNKEADKFKDEELKKSFCNRLSAMALNSIYNYKIKEFDKEVFDLLDRDFYGKNIKIRKNILKTNTTIFFCIEDIYRFFRDMISGKENNI
ncbi:hypothetical protein HMPREF1092_00396 [Clostridium thermobutyricum]|uniref:Glycosyltransferase 2-like domain-containing protein n=1 Tax=Clostridium thermobutyricum TaxID=29372 RepID=N9WK37_9CLOT|nr:glycosyltransferase [Clostridium thermobutyricum]ENZ03210.1 hypothetical protein HMPREF1092_00396 [Clostridium thermobutyricum]